MSVPSPSRAMTPVLLCALLIGFFAPVCVISDAFAANAGRPRVVLVLGGGGARGMAHIGVLKVLEEMRVPIDCIAGTSMGSLVGGVYAAGVSIEEMTDRIGAIDWNALFSDDPPRVEKPFRAKRDDYENLFRLELGQRGTSLLLAPGTTSGYKFEFLLREMVRQAGNFADEDFDDLPIPYRAMGTNIENGTSKTFERGDLVKAMRASMSVPGVIAPVEIDNVLYVDGGLLQNVPVAAARRTCADVVIAVNVGSPLLPRDKLNSALGISLQMISVLTEQNVRVSLASLRSSDVLIEPELGDFSAADFENGMSLIPKGEAAAQAKAAALRRLSVSEAEYRAWQQSVAARLPVVPPVSEIRVADSGGRVNPKVIERELLETPGVGLRRTEDGGLTSDEFSLEHLNTRLEQIYGRGDFERMDYAMLDRQGTRTVEVSGVEKSWGPNFVKFGLGLASDAQQTRFNVNLSHRSTWLNARGAEWRNDLRLGYSKFLVSEFFQPFTFNNSAFVAPRIVLQDEPISYYLDGNRIGEYRVKFARAHLDFGVQNRFGELRLGAFSGQLNADENFGLFPFAPNFSLTQVGYDIGAIYDQIDSPRFPRDGLMATLRSFGTVGGWGSGDDYNKSELLVMGAKSFGKHALQLAGYVGGAGYGKLPAYDPFLLGGFLRGSGYQMDELVGRRVGLARAVYSYRLASLPAVLGRGVFVGGSLEATQASTGTELDGGTKIRPSASLFLGADTSLGPAFLAWGQAFNEGESGTLYFMLGMP